MQVNNDNIYIMNNIIRYVNRNRIIEETVAAHTFFVNWIILNTCNELNIPDHIKLYALETAILHDIPEVITNDITSDVKRAIPQLEQLLEPIEKDIIKAVSQTAHDVLFDPQTLDQEIARALVLYADKFSVVLHSKNEIAVGNKVFEEIYDNALLKSIELKQNILKLLGGR